ncbi:membrane-bound lytic murein transglycosylase MltF [Aliivibrio fischeri]|uniref:Membrane-bound lytic murein transglycosylase F n=1 Tax=Aliivibrio fischeri TaxID=668 RepID=A0A844P368_ALIFS|nr:membrane-bound lytic murein transglycosylase MltF [Aliivibrio fischeri]MBP3141206.1 membrane-bound lytic murein transglycosylase MltF [Aliivibrio fischeri]MUK49824.1 membrane-bound lytic murein transglycosylase MltF [Aliivibrio fischeri]OCH01729.1 lytic transglycosylase F [Aliivibrio fischeri]OCH06400.1 lytic transglycosylase F [Aliivibrio fischeri]OCH27328.1 lytic transglycosylase F [Aliivibrio fischeri]
MSRIRHHRFIQSCLVISTLLITLTGCQVESEPKTKLEQIRERGILRVSTLNNQLSYYIGSNGPTGLDYDLAKAFAEKLEVKLEITPAYTYSGLFPALERNEVDIIAANMTITPERLQKFRPGPVYYYVSQQVVYKKGSWRPRNIKNLTQLDENLTIVKDSSFEGTLIKLKEKYPNLDWNTAADTDVSELLKKVATGEIHYTLADSVELSLTQRIHPDLAVAFEVTEDQPVAWFLQQTEDDSLQALLIEFFGELKESGKLALLEEKYFGHVESFDYVDTRAFIRALESKLPKWEPLFKKYAGDFDWRFLAALSYQESHWNPLAKSPTGVRGMMMLTLPTAQSVGVQNRLNPEQSIRGGAEYLRRIVKRVPDSITEHEKIWFALASYNIGFGHMMDARRLTQRLGGDPDSWTDVKDNLPLLRQHRYYRYLRYGFARGDEAQNYVENIRRYYQSIIGYEQEQANKLKQEELTVEDLQVIDVPLSSAEASVSQAIEVKK